MKIIRTHIIPNDIESIRLEDYLRQTFSFFPSIKNIQKAIKRGTILLDSKETTTGAWVASGQRIDWLEPKEQHPVYAFPMKVLYEDDYLTIINKPPGIIVSGNKHRTVTNALKFVLTPSLAEDKLSTPKPAHRLDAATSGCLLVAKTSKVLIKLNQLFESKTIKKEYHAIIQGKIAKSGVIESQIDNKEAITSYERVRCSRSLNNEWVSVVKLYPKTGRTHQLRIHLADLGFPIVGDRLYGVEGNVLKGKGLFLCATRLKFIHPVSQHVIDVEIPLPRKFENYINRESDRWNNYNL